MKRYVVLGLASLLLAFGASSSAWAFAVRVGGTDAPGGKLVQLNPPPGQAVKAKPQACSSFSGLPSDLKNQTPAFLTCFGFNNVTGESLTTLTFSFTANKTLAGQPITCSAGVYLSNWDCPTGDMVKGITYTLSFTCLPNCGSMPDGDSIGDNVDFYIGIDQPLKGLPKFSVTPNPVPEPGELGLFGLGLLGIAVAFGWRRRKQHAGSTEAELEIG